MELELLNYINVDMKWTIMKKSRSGITRHTRKPDTGSFKTNKAGTEKVVDAPLKKRRLSHQQPSESLILSGLSPGPQTPAVVDEDSGRKMKSKRKNNLLKRRKKEVVDFSGIELLADTACSNDFKDDVSVLREAGVDSCNMVMSCEKVKEEKELRLHWDLNTVMDEWEKPIEPESEGVKLNLQVCESRGDGVEERSVTNEDSFGNLIEKMSCVKKTSDVVDSVKCETQEESTVKVEQQQPVCEDGVSEGCGSNEDEGEVEYDSPFEDGELRETPKAKESLGDIGESGEGEFRPVLHNDESVSFDLAQVRSNRSGRDLGVGRDKVCTGDDHRSRSGARDGGNRRSVDIKHCRSYNNPRDGGGYRNKGRGPPFRRSRSRDRYRGFDRKPCYLDAKPRSRSPPIAWNFQKRKNLELTKTHDQPSSKCFHHPTHQNRDDHFHFQPSARFSQHKYIRKHQRHFNRPDDAGIRRSGHFFSTPETKT